MGVSAGRYHVTVLHRVQWTLSRALCDKLNVFQSRWLRSLLGIRWEDNKTNEAVRARCGVSMSLAQQMRIRRLSWTGNMPRHDDLIVHELLFSNVDAKRHHRSVVTDAADNVRRICIFVNQHLFPPLKTDDFNVACSRFHQADYLGCFKCPTCAKPYVSENRKHLNRCPQPGRATVN